MDDVSDEMHKLSRELDILEEDSMKYQVQKIRSEESNIQGRLPGECTVIAIL